MPGSLLAAPRIAEGFHSAATPESVQPQAKARRDLGFRVLRVKGLGFRSLYYNHNTIRDLGFRVLRVKGLGFRDIIILQGYDDIRLL